MPAFGVWITLSGGHTIYRRSDYPTRGYLRVSRLFMPSWRITPTALVRITTVTRLIPLPEIRAKFVIVVDFRYLFLIVTPHSLILQGLLTCWSCIMTIVRWSYTGHQSPAKIGFNHISNCEFRSLSLVAQKLYATLPEEHRIKDKRCARYLQGLREIMYERISPENTSDRLFLKNDSPLLISDKQSR